MAARQEQKQAAGAGGVMVAAVRRLDAVAEAPEWGLPFHDTMGQLAEQVRFVGRKGAQIEHLCPGLHPFSTAPVVDGQASWRTPGQSLGRGMGFAGSGESGGRPRAARASLQRLRSASSV